MNTLGMRVLLLPLTAAALLLAPACRRETETAPQAAEATAANARPNVLFISIDTLRADHLGSYGYGRPTSPNIDRLASDGVRFANAFSQASWTLPAHMSMMTSQYPHVHGVQNQDDALPDGAVTIAETFAAADYRTAALISWVFVSKQYGFEQGFDEFHELLPPPEQIDSETSAAFRAEQVTDRAIEWLATRDDEPFFLFVHYFDPHISYDPPAPYRDMFGTGETTSTDGGPADGTFEHLSPYVKGLHHEPERIDPADLVRMTALYDGEVRYTDEHVGRLLDAVQATVGVDNCLIVLTSDHGEELDDHGSMEGHQWTLYDEVVHVPLIIRPPGGLKGGRVIETPVELIDIAPTLAASAGLTPPAAFQGIDRSELLTGAGPALQGGFAYGEISRFNRKQFVRDLRFKLIYTEDTGLNARGVPVRPGYELYDLRDDPGEQRNVFDANSRVARRLMEELDRRRASSVDLPPARPATVAIDPAHLQRLRAVGYVGG